VVLETRVVMVRRLRHGVLLARLLIMEHVLRRLKGVISVARMGMPLSIVGIKGDVIGVVVKIIRLLNALRRIMKRRRTITPLKPKLVLFR